MVHAHPIHFEKRADLQGQNPRMHFSLIFLWARQLHRSHLKWNKKVYSNQQSTDTLVYIQKQDVLRKCIPMIALQ